MKYATFITTNATPPETPADPPIGSYVLRLNSVFDPDAVAPGGDQPYGMDTLEVLYNRYRVISCGWVIQRPAGTAEASAPLMVGCIPSNDPGVNYGNINDLRESPRARFIVQNPGSAVKNLRGKQYLPNLVGRTNAQYMADDNYQAIVTQNPTENCLLYIQTTNPITTSPTSAALIVMLEYTVEFFDVKHLVPSA